MVKERLDVFLEGIEDSSSSRPRLNKRGLRIYDILGKLFDVIDLAKYPDDMKDEIIDILKHIESDWGDPNAFRGMLVDLQDKAAGTR